MSAADGFLAGCVGIGLALLGLAFLLVVVRLVKGPTLPDRILALDMMTGVAVGFIVVFGIGAGLTLVVDIALALGLVGFLATVALARFVATRGSAGDDQQTPPAKDHGR